MADPGRLDELKRKFEENPKRYFAPLANEYRKAGEPELAIELCRTYLPQQPTHMSGYIVYGQSLHDAGHTDEAAAVFKQALTLDPENIIALRQLGDIARDAGDRAGAMRWYGKVLELDPRNEEIAAYITSLAEPDAKPAAASGPERQAPPTVRPEPAHDDSAVRLEDIVAAPDVAQSPFSIDEALDTDPDPFVAEELAEEREAAQPFEVTEWPTALEAMFPGGGEAATSETSTPVLEGPWHAAPPTQESAHDDAATADDEPAQEDHPQSAPAAATTEPSPFVTETMAELYLSQGLHGEALVIYRELVRKRDDPALHRKIAELEAQQTAPGESAVQGEPEAAAASDVPRETVRAFFARIGARRPDERVELAADRAHAPASPSPLSSMFASASTNAEDLAAAQRLSGAFGSSRPRDSNA